MDNAHARRYGKIWNARVEGSGWENVSIESQRMVAGKLERLIATSDLNERVKENMKKLMARNETWLNVKEG